MKRNLFRTACNLFTGAAAYQFFTNAAFADTLAPTTGPVYYIIGESHNAGPNGGMILLLGLASVTLTAVAIVIIINIRRKNGK